MTDTTSAEHVVSQRAFLGVSAIVFAASAAMTIAWCTSMSATGAMPMPGGWTMSMVWMRMPGQTWLGAAAAFVGMWVVMMTAMMLPSLAPALWRYHEAVTLTRGPRLGAMTGSVAAGYLFVWTVLGVAVFALGVALATVQLRLPAVARTAPIVAGVVVMIAGAVQFSAWKQRHLACFRAQPSGGRPLSARVSAGWRYGLRLGLHCGQCSAGPTVILLAVGVMDLRAMAAVALVTTAERLAPDGERVARGVGVLVVGAGLVLIARAVAVG